MCVCVTIDWNRVVNMIRQQDGHFSVDFLIEPFKLWGAYEVRERMVRIDNVLKEMEKAKMMYYQTSSVN